MASNQAIIDQTYLTKNTSGSLSTSIGTTYTFAPASFNVLKVNGDAEFEGDITIKGKNLIEHLEKIDERLCILHPNIELEEKYIELKKLRKQYMDLEKEILEKEQIWATLKK